MPADSIKGDWFYTEYAHAAAKTSRGAFEEGGFWEGKKGKWQGRDLIHRDSRINKGVYLCAGVGREPLGEACVVDDSKMPALLSCYEELKRRAGEASERTGLPLKQLMLETAFGLTQEVMPYNSDYVESVANQHVAGAKVGLDVYLYGAGGVCRHQALLAGYLIEKMVDEGILHGKVSVDRNFVPGEGGHAWVRYTNSGGEVFILDTAQNYCGSLERSKKEAGWDYRRPNEMSREERKNRPGLINEIKNSLVPKSMVFGSVK